MDLGLRGASVLITGGSRGIGRALALAFAQEGARVAICARGSDRLNAVAAEVRGCAYRKLCPAVLMVQATEDRCR